MAMHLAFVDESGTSSASSPDRYFVVAVLVAAALRPIELHVRRARRALHREAPASELKAAHSSERIVRRMLAAIAGETCEVYAAVVDKQGMPGDNSESVYQYAVAQAVSFAAQVHPELHVIIDKRYTSSRQRLALERCIREALRPVTDQVVIVEQLDSSTHAGLQAVDFVAWAVGRQFERGEAWTDIIASKIVTVEVLQGKTIAARPGSR